MQPPFCAGQLFMLPGMKKPLCLSAKRLSIGIILLLR